VNRLSAERNVLFVVAAGNDGAFGAHTVGSPASADAALAVGAVDKHDAIAGFSGRGPRVGDEALKPDITAPGVSITAARSADSPLGAPDEPHTTLSGTSMAAPHVAGAAALLAQEHPQWTATELKAALMASAGASPRRPGHRTGRGPCRRRAGHRPDGCGRPAQRELRTAGVPYDTPATRTLTYRNRGDAAVALTAGRHRAVQPVGDVGDRCPQGGQAASRSPRTSRPPAATASPAGTWWPRPAAPASPHRSGSTASRSTST
jgi:hypothetical protein